MGTKKRGESESEGCRSTTSQSRTLAATLSSLSRCWSLAREGGSRWLCLLQSPGGTKTGISQRGGEKRQQKIEMTHFSSRTAKNPQQQKLKQHKVFIQNCQKQCPKKKKKKKKKKK